MKDKDLLDKGDGQLYYYYDEDIIGFMDLVPMQSKVMIDGVTYFYMLGLWDPDSELNIAVLMTISARYKLVGIRDDVF